MRMQLILALGLATGATVPGGQIITELVYYDIATAQMYTDSHPLRPLPKGQAAPFPQDSLIDQFLNEGNAGPPTLEYSSSLGESIPLSSSPLAVKYLSVSYTLLDKNGVPMNILMGPRTP